MAEHPKRQREDVTQAGKEFDDTKRHKLYSHILSILEDEEEEDEPCQDSLDIFTTLQQELYSPLPPSSPFSATSGGSLPGQQVSAATAPPNFCAPADEEEDDKDGVMRRLLEASDDELGLPNAADGGEREEHEHQPFALCNGLWEFEDEAAYYNTLMQSQLFM